jgi:predicted transcriptional regulator
MKVVGEAKVEAVLEDTPSKVWSETKSKSGISKDFFQKYYDGQNTAFAFKLSDVVK